MTRIINTLTNLALVLATLFMAFSAVSAQAQYGGTTITLPPTSTSGTTGNTSTSTSTSGTTLTANNRCSGSNVSSSVAGETLNINLCNIKSGNTIILNNLSTSSLESVELSFNSDVADGLFQIVKIPESLAFPNLRSTFITGFEALTSRFDSSAIRSIKLTYKVDKNTINRFSNTNAFTSNSPWVATNLTRVSEDASFVKFSSTTGSFKQYALSGTANTTNSSFAPMSSPTSTLSRYTSNFDLIRTGGMTESTGVLILGLVSLAAYSGLGKRNTLKI